MTEPIRYSSLAAPAQAPEGTIEVLHSAFTEPPYEYTREAIGQHVGNWPTISVVPGFRVETAHRGEALVGIAWGWDSAVTTGQGPAGYAKLYADLAAQPWADALVGTEVVELGVSPTERGSGIGEALLARLTGGAPAWLLTDPESAAAGWYARRGWQRHGVVRGSAIFTLAPTPTD